MNDFATKITSLALALAPEVLLRAARIGSFRLWQADNYAAMNDDSGPERGLKIALHRLRFM